MVSSTLPNEKALREIINTLMEMPQPTSDDVNRLKIKTAGKYQLEEVPSNADLISLLTPKKQNGFCPFCGEKIPALSQGVTVIATMTKPYPCPQPKPCAYCPGGPSQAAPKATQDTNPRRCVEAKTASTPTSKFKAAFTNSPRLGIKWIKSN